MTRLALALCVVTLVTGAALAQQPVAKATSFPGPTDKFDPARDAAADITAAVAEAKRAGKRVILDVGGEWCGWCHTLDRYFAENADLREMRDKHYVWLKVNYGDGNKNEVVLGRYPQINGYPHLFVLDKDGKLLQSQDTALLEEKSSYNHTKMVEFLTKWASIP